MKAHLWIGSLIMLLALGSCSDDEPTTGKLIIRYETGNWTPQKLYLYDATNSVKVIREITTTGFRTVELNIPVGNYILLDRESGKELRFTIESGKTTQVYYHKKTLILEKDKVTLAVPAGECGLWQHHS